VTRCLRAAGLAFDPPPSRRRSTRPRPGPTEFWIDSPSGIPGDAWNYSADDPERVTSITRRIRATVR